MIPLGLVALLHMHDKHTSWPTELCRVKNVALLTCSLERLMYLVKVKMAISCDRS